MSIQNKLQELKEMHEKGLISSAVYEEQQKSLLATQLSNTEYKSSPAETAINSSQKSEFLDAKKGISALSKIFAAFLIILGGIWLIFTLSGSEGKTAVSQFASETGIGTQVIPWPDRASAIASSLITENQQQIANSIQGITHPTGEEAMLHNFQVKKLNDAILIELNVSWKGGFLGGNYNTIVSWEINENGHVKAKVTNDNASVSIEPKNAEILDNYFYTKVYPAFIKSMGS